MAAPHAINLSAGWSRDGARHTRRFQWPKPLTAGESLWLVLALDAPAVVTLNGVELVGDGEFELVGVAISNELAVVTAGAVAAARLEVRG